MKIVILFLSIINITSAFSQGLSFDFYTRNELENPSEEKKKTGNFHETDFCKRQSSHYSERILLKADFDEAVDKKMQSCYEMIKSDEGIACFNIELETKTKMQDCSREAERAYQAGRKNEYDLYSCQGAAIDWGDKALAEAKCNRKVQWSGSVHITRMLTGHTMESFCTLQGGPSNLHMNSPDGTQENSQLYNKDFNKIHWKYYTCLRQGCYDTMRDYYPKLINKQREIAKKCNEPFLNVDLYQLRGINYSQMQIPFEMMTKDDTFIKNQVTDYHLKMAKIHKGDYINNTVIRGDKGPSGESLTPGWFTFHLDTKGEFVHGRYSPMFLGDAALKIFPYLNEKYEIEFTDRSKGHIKWTYNREQPGVNIDDKIPASSDMTVTENVAGKKEESEPNETASKDSMTNKDEVKKKQVAQTFDCSGNRFNNTINSFKEEQSVMSMDLQMQLRAQGCSKNNKENCNKAEVRKIISDFNQSGKNLTQKIEDFRVNKLIKENPGCAKEYSNVKSVITKNTKNSYDSPNQIHSIRSLNRKSTKSKLTGPKVEHKLNAIRMNDY